MTVENFKMVQKTRRGKNTLNQSPLPGLDWALIEYSVPPTIFHYKFCSFFWVIPLRFCCNDFRSWFCKRLSEVSWSETMVHQKKFDLNTHSVHLVSQRKTPSLWWNYVDFCVCIAGSKSIIPYKEKGKNGKNELAVDGLISTFLKAEQLWNVSYM